MNIRTDSLMNLMRISDSFFPIGSFTTSQGIEQFVADKLVNSKNLVPVLEAYVNNVWSSLEVPVFREALEAVEADDLERLINADHVCYASKLAEESRDSSVKMGEIDYLAAQEAVQHVIDSVPTPPPFGEEYQSFPLADIESMRHEYSNNRMFMS